MDQRHRQLGQQNGIPKIHLHGLLKRGELVWELDHRKKRDRLLKLLKAMRERRMGLR